MLALEALYVLIIFYNFEAPYGETSNLYVTGISGSVLSYLPIDTGFS